MNLGRKVNLAWSIFLSQWHETWRLIQTMCAGRLKNLIFSFKLMGIIIQY